MMYINRIKTIINCFLNLQYRERIQEMQDNKNELISNLDVEPERAKEILEKIKIIGDSNQSFDFEKVGIDGTIDAEKTNEFIQNKFYINAPVGLRFASFAEMIKYIYKEIYIREHNLKVSLDIRQTINEFLSNYFDGCQFQDCEPLDEIMTFDLRRAIKNLIVNTYNINAREITYKYFQKYNTIFKIAGYIRGKVNTDHLDKNEVDITGWYETKTDKTGTGYRYRKIRYTDVEGLEEGNMDARFEFEFFGSPSKP